jgi:hypothetical protein
MMLFPGRAGADLIVDLYTSGLSVAPEYEVASLSYEGLSDVEERIEVSWSGIVHRNNGSALKGNFTTAATQVSEPPVTLLLAGGLIGFVVWGWWRRRSRFIATRWPKGHRRRFES